MDLPVVAHRPATILTRHPMTVDTGKAFRPEEPWHYARDAV